MYDAITDVPGIRVGHATDLEGATGCTVLLCEQGALAGVDQRGGAPGTRETDLLRPLHLVQQVHAVLLAGGSAFGLDAAGGVVRYLRERDIGFPAGPVKVPIVPAAVLFDLSLGRGDVWPDATMGYRACQEASSGPVAQGSVGVGTGAMVGHIFGPERAMKSGVGTAGMELAGGVRVGALMAVNAFGDVVDPATGRILAGARLRDSEGLADTMEVMRGVPERGCHVFPGTSTVIGVVATNARLSKEEVNKVAQMAYAGLARTIRPAGTMWDGDTLFALATGEKKAEVSVVGAFAAEVVARAIVRAVLTATALHGIPAHRDLHR